MKNVSTTRARELAMYSKMRKMFLDVYPDCINCGAPATDIHHKAGRIGARLYEFENLLPVCRACHQYIEEHPAWAKKVGFSANRL